MERSVDIGALPEVVYALVSDVARQSRFVVESTDARWLTTARGVGARFRAGNRNGLFRWWTTAEVTHAEPGRCFAYRVRSFGAPVAEWRYDIEVSDLGCRVTESTRDLRNRFFRTVVAPVGTGVVDRDSRNEVNIEKTLARLKALAEAPS
ncbi:SRPBCC family protein [Allokutzneria sp. A3M-2-11 16]|uniref:SRPBCC family protein n=1 Tax=Allokutzneria sp. A3M-2-11 16 TaxID=2962043 RepID=UPI0020B66F78|nr:SRPBCC family protein [Allokutzneria sp. A3M-2-11 16]MCP3799084.1 SRPBCC family protein [Allokutzneria sp. A3M-2-11 16]